MENKLEVKKECRLINREFIDKVESLENAMLASDDPRIAKGNTDMFPLKHSFSNGVYIREMFMPKGGLVIGKLYKISHTWFLLSGELLIFHSELLAVQYLRIFLSYLVMLPALKRLLHQHQLLFLSMYPKYCSGDRVALKKIEDREVISFGEAYLIITKEQRLLKYVHKGKDIDHWVLKSENKEFDSFDINHKNKVLHVYIVKGKITKNIL